MLLSQTPMPVKTVNALKAKKIYTVNDLVRHLPRKYKDYREIKPLQEVTNTGRCAAIRGYMQNIKKDSGKVSMITAEVIEETSGMLVKVRWFGAAHLMDIYQKYVFNNVVIGGVVTHDKWGYMVTSPDLFTIADNFHGRILSIYPKTKGVTDDMKVKWIDAFLETIEDPLDPKYVQTAHLLPYKEALKKLHHPKNMDDVEQGVRRLLFNDMLYFTLKMKSRKKEVQNGIPIQITKTEQTEAYLSNLGYELTGDQRRVINSIKERMLNRIRVNDLIQGDVGCGKTTVAMAAMLFMAENGMQSAIMVPRTALVTQHYETFRKMSEKTGVKVACLSKEIGAKEKREILAGLKDGSIQIVVGSHNLFTEKVMYHNLGLVVTDEEHLFSPGQRDALAKKASTGAHIITMSATPIPRSLVDVIYGEDKNLEIIYDKPANRIPVQTFIRNSMPVIFHAAEKMLKEGRQVFVVCPLVKNKEEEEGVDEVTSKLDSVEDTYKVYQSYFEPMGFKVGLMHGQMAAGEAEIVRKAFVENQYQILVSTTVIEVGIDVPNAALIIIHNAERFGLASLHQIRGRVGRGQYASYCILKSEFKDNERLLALTSTNDGMVLAKKDLELRGPGDLLGSAQSGSNKYIEMIISKEKLYNAIKKYAEWIIAEGREKEILSLYDECDEAEKEREAS